MGPNCFPPRWNQGQPVGCFPGPCNVQARLPENDGMAERMRRRNVEFELRYGDHRHSMRALESLTGAFTAARAGGEDLERMGW